ncbi:ELWxxDGT repeat protein, partial [Spirosoma sp.]|uniref:ELWxxDGT repeat protein n=1 Tax=Spirosoma sp. TaxID=1899569 RepID=UPI003B3A9F9A
MKQLYTVVTLLLCLCSTVLRAQTPVMVKDIYPGSGNGIDPYSVNPIVGIDGTAYFVGTDAEHGNELWKSDGTELGTQLVKDIYPGSNASNPSSLINVKGVLYFNALDPQSGYCLFKSDGTVSGTVKVKSFNQNYVYNQPHNLTDVNGTLFFVVNNGYGGEELWKSDGTDGGTVRVKNINPGGSSYLGSLVNANGTLYFI